VWVLHDGVTDSFFVLSQAWSSTGVRKGGNRVVTSASPAAGPQVMAAAALGDGRLRLAWWDAASAVPAVVTAVIDSAGTVQEGPLPVSAGPITAHDPCIAVDDTGRWAVGWSQSNGTSEDLVWQRFDADGTPTSPSEQISAATPATRRRGGTIAFSGGYVYGAWFDNEIAGKGYDVRLSSLLKSSADIGPEGLMPLTFVLHPNYPNPFNGQTKIAYELARPGRVQLTVFDLLGRTVRHLANGRESAGSHAFVWDGTDDYGQPVASGVYFYRLAAGAHSQTRKMLYLK